MIIPNRYELLMNKNYSKKKGNLNPNISIQLVFINTVLCVLTDAGGCLAFVGYMLLL